MVFSGFSLRLDYTVHSLVTLDGGTMSIQIHWLDDEQTLLNLNFSGTFTLEDFYQTINKTQAMIAAEQHTVHVIADFTQCDSISSKLLAAAKYTANAITPNLGAAVVISNSVMLNTLVHTALITQKTLQNYVSLAACYEKAFKIIKQHEEAEHHYAIH